MQILTANHWTEPGDPNGRFRERLRELKELKELKVGDFFKLKPTGRVYVRGEYVRSLKRYSYYDFDDVCREHFAKGRKRVIVNFEF